MKYQYVEPKVHRTLSMDVPLDKAMREIAYRRGMTYSAIVREALEYYVQLVTAGSTQEEETHAGTRPTG